MEIQELETILNDPEYYINEYCGKIQNEIDIKAEQEIIKTNNNEDEIKLINTKREELFYYLNRFRNECKLATEIFKDEINEMKKWIQNLTKQDFNEEMKIKLNECIR